MNGGYSSAREVKDTVIRGCGRLPTVSRLCLAFQFLRQAPLDVAVQPPAENEPDVALTFVPIVTAAAPVVKPVRSASLPAVIAIKLAGAVVRVVSGTDTALLSEVLRAVRASVSPT